MRRVISLWRRLSFCLLCLVVLTSFAMAQDQPDEKEKAEKKVADKTSASRLRAVREIMGQITMKSTVGDEPQPLELKPDPLLRYNDVTRGILDSVIFRVGTNGRPAALISAELYGRQGERFLLNHEFVALYEPRVRMKRDVFIWEPPTGTLTFQQFPAAEPPLENPRLRLTQMRRLAEQFTASQMFGNSRIELRRMATPIDRYEPSHKPRADGSIFAFAWGVNPEAVLFIESDGEKWLYAWAPLSSAPLEAKLGEAVAWQCPRALLHENRSAPYTSIHRSLFVPKYFDDPEEEEKPRPKRP
jgi:hypothetical protein